MTKRIFVIGNGPSLKPGDLDLIARSGFDSFGTNRIQLIYDKTKWRPTYWMIADRSKSTMHAADTDLHLHEGYPCYVRADIPRGAEAIMWAKEFPDTFIPFAECDHIDVLRNPANAWHFPRLCKCGGSLSCAIQQSVILGYDQIILLGCDGNIKANRNNHFDSHYVDVDVVSGPDDEKCINRTLELAHRVALDECRKRGIELLSATRAGRHWGHRQVCLEDYLT
jgi:hypothetical protein